MKILIKNLNSYQFTTDNRLLLSTDKDYTIEHANFVYVKVPGDRTKNYINFVPNSNTCILCKGENVDLNTFKNEINKNKNK